MGKSLGRIVRSRGRRHSSICSPKTLAWTHRRHRSEPGATNEDLIAMEIFTGSTGSSDDAQGANEQLTHGCEQSGGPNSRKENSKTDKGKKMSKRMARKDSIIRSLARR